MYDPIFFENSYGFRPGRNTYQAVGQAKAYMQEGKRLVMDMVLEKFFDKVSQDKTIKDSALFRIIKEGGAPLLDDY